MSPIACPKRLNQILMYGCAAVLSEPNHLPLLKSNPLVRSTLNDNYKKSITTLPPPRRPASTKTLAPRTTYTSLPNSNFILKVTDFETDTDPQNEDHTARISISSINVDSASELAASPSVLNVEGQKDTSSISSSTACSLSIAVSVSTVPSARSSVSIEPPSTTATSIPPWCYPQPVEDPTAKFGLPSPVSTKYARVHAPPIDSLRIIRQRRSDQAADTSSSGIFISRPRKNSEAKGLKGFGLRSLKALKRVKW